MLQIKNSSTQKREKEKKNADLLETLYLSKRALQEAEKERKASADDMFVDVYSEPTRELRRQAKILDVHLRGSMKNYNM